MINNVILGLWAADPCVLLSYNKSRTEKYLYFNQIN